MTLLSWTTAGRAPASTLCVDHPRVSGAHAVIAWTGSEWVVQDLASRNGTFLDGQRIEPGARVPLMAGAVLGFASDGELWRLEDHSPPAARGVPDDGGPAVTGRPGLLALPDEEDPLVVLYPGPADWVLEEHGEQRAVFDGDSVVVGGRRWRLELPLILPNTVAASASVQLADLVLHFRVSADEEHVQIDAAHPGGVLAVPVRVHHYMLLTLARSRLSDRAGGVGPLEEGWEDVDTLARRLGLTSNAFHVQLCRAKAQLGALGVDGAGALVERRGGGKVRLGVGKVEITRLT